MADGVVAVTLGYGRSHAGRVGSGVGFDTYVSGAPKSPGFGGGVKLTKVGRTYALSSTQHHGSMEGRPLVRESTVAELRSKPEARRLQRDAKTEGGRSRRLSVFSRKNRLTSPSGRSTPTTGPPVGDDDRPELLHRLQRVHGRLPEREQHTGRRQGPGREGPRDALDPGRPLLLRRALRESGSGLSARALHAVRGCPVRTGLPRGCDGARRAGPQRDGLQPVHRDALLLEQLSLQGAPLQLLQLHQGHARDPQARDEP